MTEHGSAPERQRAFLDDRFAALLGSSPEVAAELGIDRVGTRPITQDGFADISPAGQATRAKHMADALAALRRLPAAVPHSTDALDRELFEFFLRWCDLGRLPGTESRDFLFCDSPGDHVSGVQTELLTLLAQWHPLAAAGDLGAYERRLAGVGRQIDALIEALAARVAVGNVMPACIVTRVQAELRSFLACPLRENPLALRVSGFGVSDDVARSLTLIADVVQPAYRRLVAYLETYPEEIRIGLCRMARGADYYGYLLKVHTTTELTAREIHEIGLAEAERLRFELSAKLHDAGYPGGGFAECFRAFECDDRFRLRTTGDPATSIQAQIEAIIHEAEQRLMPLFGIRPKARVVAQAIPPMQEPNLHSTYVPPAQDGSRPGVFRFNARQLLAGTRPDLYTITYHETIPGHHVQLTIAQELRADLPAFRRAVVHTGYIEGWAKYAEILPWIEGVNGDPYWDIARTGRELISTANLIVDTGIHAFGWSRDAAIEAFERHTACAREMTESIVDRSVARPAQLCAYKIGMLCVLGARRRMERALGQRFDVRRFHDTVLRHGSVPLPVLDRVVDAEIAATQRGAPTQTTVEPP